MSTTSAAYKRSTDSGGSKSPDFRVLTEVVAVRWDSSDPKDIAPSSMTVINEPNSKPWMRKSRSWMAS